MKLEEQLVTMVLLFAEIDSLGDRRIDMRELEGYLLPQLY